MKKSRKSRLAYSRQDIERLLQETIEQLNANTRFSENRHYLQHGKQTVYDHCICVAEKSCEIAWKLKLDVDYKRLIRGALLHDYFLYDWHEKDASHRLHGFFHPGKACNNARRDAKITELEEDIIRHHMFPLTLVPPQSREAWIVCLADKICAAGETIRRK